MLRRKKVAREPPPREGSGKGEGGVDLITRVHCASQFRAIRNQFRICGSTLLFGGKHVKQVRREID